MQPPIVVSHKNSGTKPNENVLFGARTWWNNSVFLLIPAPQVHFHRKNFLERFFLHFTDYFTGRKANITPWNSDLLQMYVFCDHASRGRIHTWTHFPKMPIFSFSFSPHWRIFYSKNFTQKCGVKNTDYNVKFIPAFMC